MHEWRVDEVEYKQVAGMAGEGTARPVARARRALAPLVVLCALWGLGASCCSGQEKPKDKVLFLVARPSILDPYFAHSVVLMVPLEGVPMIVGLIVNKPAPPKLLELIPEDSPFKKRSAITFYGGPVDVGAPSLIFHTSKPPKDAVPLYGDVYLSFDTDFISQLLQDPKQTGELRLFLGRSQWSPEQLRGETLRGSWYNLRAEGELLFDRDSTHLWERLHDRAKPAPEVQNQPLHPGPSGDRRPTRD